EEKVLVENRLRFSTNTKYYRSKINSTLDVLISLYQSYLTKSQEKDVGRRCCSLAYSSCL
ncbi:hypothetical protein, partial [Enterococcus faecium]